MAIANKVSYEEAMILLGKTTPAIEKMKLSKTPHYTKKSSKEKNANYGLPSPYTKDQSHKLRKGCGEAHKGKQAIEYALNSLCKNIAWYGEYLFCEGRLWRFDYAIPSLKIAIEYEGNTFGESRHTKGVGYASDTCKYNAATLLGWKVLRYEASLAEDRVGLELQMALTPEEI
jgi:hypothetical protein